jgi:esterase/lipase
MFQKLMYQGFRATFKLIEIVVPALAGKWAIHLFFKPRKFKRPKSETPLIQGASIQKRHFKSSFNLENTERYYIQYEWGNPGNPTILLVHGWEGRASQMATFVKPLLSAGCHVLAFDAPAHGGSPGKKTNLPEIVEVIKDIEKRNSGFDGIIAHSLGGVIAAYAIQHGVECKNLVTIGSPARMEFISSEFAQKLGASQNTIKDLINFLESFSGKNAQEFSLTNIISTLDISGLIIHDKNDKEVPYSLALDLNKHWENNQLMLTEGLGHRRILRDKKTIKNVVEFLVPKKKKKEIMYAEAI